ncbi:Transposase IS66 family, partial [hydrothermal vent metagenome]
MTIQGFDINKQIAEIEQALKSEKNLSPAMVSMIKMLILIVQLLVNKSSLNSRNSSKPPSTDQKGSKSSKDDNDNSKSSTNKQGGQKGHLGSTLKQVAKPDEIEHIKINRSTIPVGIYTEIGFEKRQVFDICIKRVVTEYQAQVLMDENGKRYVADFPKGVTKATQYGNTLKAHSVYMSQYQLIPYNRLKEYFTEQLNIPISAGTLYNFNLEAYNKLEKFEEIVKNKLAHSKIIHADETGINVGGKLFWCHVNSNKLWTYLFPHKKRGYLAMEAMGVLPHFKGILCHDHWKTYYRFILCLHALCNAHHIRELTRSYEQDSMQWANDMIELLFKIKKTVDDSGGSLNKNSADIYIGQYRALLKEAELQCPPPDPNCRKKGQRGRLKRSKSRNLLERLINYEDDVLRFMLDVDVPFTNNQGENDLRMKKVQQKISGCFR